MRKAVLVIVAVLSAVACGKGSGGGAAKVKPEDALKQVNATVVPEANKAVPGDLASKLAFEAVLGEDKDYAVAAPKGWKAGPIPGRLKPADEAGLGFMTDFSAGSNCDGACEPKKWEETADKVEFAQFKGSQFQVQKDEKVGATGRVLVAKADDRVYVRVAFWKEGASHYFHCGAALEKEIAGAAPAFEKACLGLKILGW